MRRPLFLVLAINSLGRKASSLVGGSVILLSLAPVKQVAAAALAAHGG